MTDSTADARLAEIRARVEGWQNAPTRELALVLTGALVGEDVPWLLAEIDRLKRAAIEEATQGEVECEWPSDRHEGVVVSFDYRDLCIAHIEAAVVQRTREQIAPVEEARRDGDVVDCSYCSGTGTYITHNGQPANCGGCFGRGKVPAAAVPAEVGEGRKDEK